MPTVYFARWILLADGSIQENGAIAVDNGHITGVGPRSAVRRNSTDRIVNLGPLLLLPGLINAHTHLEEGVVRGCCREGAETFASFSAKRFSRMRLAQPAEIAGAVRLGVRELLASGITTVADMSSRWISPSVLASEPIRSWVIHQLHCDTPENERGVLEGLRNHLANFPAGPSIGIGPYSLYSLSPDSQRRVIHTARANQWRWVSHVAETAEELQAFSEQCGDLYEQIVRNTPWPYGDNPQGPMHYALTANLIPNDALCLHCNYVTGHELALLAAKQVSIGICPLHTDRQGNKPFPLESALKRGINVCAITESLADSDGADLLDELFALRLAYPHIPALQLIKMATINAARALGAATQLGSLEPGKAADIIGMSLRTDSASELLEMVLTEEPMVRFVMVAGEEIIIDK